MSGNDVHRVPLPEYPRPQLVRDSYLTLNGRWEYAIAPVDRPERPEFTGEIVVPFPPEAPLSGVERILQPDEFLWYRRTFTLPDGFDVGRVLLHFGAVDQDCDVWIDGTPVGGHEGGYLPFHLDITDALDRDEHELVVRVRDVTETSHRTRGKQSLNPGGIWYTPVSGIWQSVWIESVPTLHVERLVITPWLDDDELEVLVEADGPATAHVTVRAGDEVLARADVPAGTPTRIPVPGARRWSPEDPFLHDVDVRLGDDEVRSYFGMRSVGIGVDAGGHARLLLNGEPYLHRGLLDQGYWPDGLLTAPSDEALARDVEIAKELGFNTLRKHVKIEPLRWYYHCDRLGVLVWQDMVSGGEPPSRAIAQGPVVVPLQARDNRYRAFGRKDAAGREQFLDELDGMVRLLQSVPSIAVWVPFNEGWGQFDAREVAERVRRSDPSRVIDHASGWHDQGGGDIASEHVYFKAVKPSDKALAGPRATAVTEYGGYAHRVPLHTWSQHEYGYRKFKHRGRLALAFEKLQRTEIEPAIERGLAAFIYTQLSDVESETNGLVTYDREVVKIDPAKSRAINDALDEAFRRSLGEPARAIRVAEREITEAISLTRSDGTLNPDAVGWTRTPIINTDGIASGLRGLGRNKRWEYWAVTTPSHIVAFTISHVDYACVLGMWALDRATGETVAVDAVVPPASGVELPGTLGQGRAYARTKNLLLRVDEVPSGSRLRVMTDRVSFDIVAHLPAGHESLGVVVPWTDNLFQYTVKDVARPATGTIWFDGATHDVSKGAFATLDHGRGRWPYKVSWNWGAGSGVVGRKRVGIQVGGQWTDRTGSVENAFFVDGRMHKISQELLWDYSPEDWMRPWRVTGDGVDLLFTPFHVREAKTDVKVFSSETYQCFGEWSGSVEADGGSIAFEGLTGWVEDVHNRW